MKNLKKMLFLPFVAILFLTVNSHAQNQRSAPNRPGSEENFDRDYHAERLEKMSAELNLDDIQKEKIQRLMEKRQKEMRQFREEQREKMEELRNDESDSEDLQKQRKDIRDARLELQEEFKADLKQILNEEQYARFEEMQEQRKAQKNQMHQKRKGRNAQEMKPSK